MAAVSLKDVGRELRTIKIVASRELAIQIQYRNKFLIDVFSHILGIAPIILITIAMSGSSLDGNGLTDATAARVAFVLLGFIAFLAFGFGAPIMLYSGMGWGISNEVTTGTLERNFLAPVSRPGIILGFGMYYVALYSFHVLTLMVLALLLVGDEIELTSSGIGVAGAAVGSLLLLSVSMGLLSAGVYLLVRDHSFFPDPGPPAVHDALGRDLRYRSAADADRGPGACKSADIWRRRVQKRAQR